MGIYSWKEQVTKYATKLARRHRRRRNALARRLSDPMYRQQVVVDKKKLLKRDRKFERVEINEVIRQELD
jgi:hypothetical protein